MDRYKLSALIGTVIMGIGSFMGCLAENPVYINTGNALLVVRDRKSTRLNSSHLKLSRMPSSA